LQANGLDESERRRITVSELNSLHLNLEQNVQAQSPVDKFGDAVRDIYSKGAAFKVDEKNILPEVAVGAAIGAAAILGWRSFMPNLAQKEGENLMTDMALARAGVDASADRAASQISFSTPLEKNAMNELPKVSKEIDELAQKLDPNYRYFEHSRGVGSTVYRWPNNGLPLEKQDISAVERFLKDGRWVGSQRERLMDELFKGWFDEESDQISTQKALDIMKKTIE